MNKIASQIIVAMLIGTSLAASPAMAQETKSEHEVSFNLGAVTDYRYRGISQTALKPALQGGADYVNSKEGIYAGAWLSTIKWTKDAGGDGDIEIDLYAGKRGALTEAVSYDIGVLSYVYPSNGLKKVTGFADANTTEIYGQISVGAVYAKYSHSITNLFGFVDSKSSGYLDIGANIDVTNGYTLNLHAGRQTVKNNNAYAYNDFKIGLTKEWNGINWSAAVIGTDADKKLFITPRNKFTGKTNLVVSAVKTF